MHARVSRTAEALSCASLRSDLHVASGSCWRRWGSSGAGWLRRWRRMAMGLWPGEASPACGCRGAIASDTGVVALTTTGNHQTNHEAMGATLCQQDGSNRWRGREGTVVYPEREVHTSTRTSSSEAPGYTTACFGRDGQRGYHTLLGVMVSWTWLLTSHASACARFCGAYMQHAAPRSYAQPCSLCK